MLEICICPGNTVLITGLAGGAFWSGTAASWTLPSRWYFLNIVSMKLAREILTVTSLLTIIEVAFSGDFFVISCENIPNLVTLPGHVEHSSILGTL